MNQRDRLVIPVIFRRNFRVLMRTLIAKFDDEDPAIESGFETRVDQQGFLDHVSESRLYTLDCGHIFMGQFVECSCQPPRRFCPECAALPGFFSRCNVCSRILCAACRHHSMLSGRDYCAEHSRQLHRLLGR